MNWRDITLQDLMEHMIDEDLEGQKAQRGEFIKNKLGPMWRGLPGYKKDDAGFDKFIEKVGEIDPTPKGIYMPWIARLALVAPAENRTEDLDRLTDDLRNFEQFKRQIERKDINQYKSFADLFDVIAPFLAPKKKSKEDLAKEKASAELEKVKADIITVYAGADGWIRIPTTQASATFLGQGTRWCTAGQKNNMFTHYNRSDNLFVVYDKASKARFQLHIDSGQFAGEDDRNKGMSAVPSWAREPILNYYKKNNPKLSFKQITTLSTFGDENLAKGTQHEGMIDLMWMYENIEVVGSLLKSGDITKALGLLARMQDYVTDPNVPAGMDIPKPNSYNLASYAEQLSDGLNAMAEAGDRKKAQSAADALTKGLQVANIKFSK